MEKVFIEKIEFLNSIENYVLATVYKKEQNASKYPWM